MLPIVGAPTVVAVTSRCMGAPNCWRTYSSCSTSRCMGAPNCWHTQLQPHLDAWVLPIVGTPSCGRTQSLVYATQLSTHPVGAISSRSRTRSSVQSSYGGTPSCRRNPVVSHTPTCGAITFPHPFVDAPGCMYDNVHVQFILWSDAESIE